MSASSPIAVGILADQYLMEWQRRAIEKLQNEAGIDVPLVVINDDATDSDDADPYQDARQTIELSDFRRFVDLLGERNAWALVAAERRLFWKLGAEEPLGHRHDTAEVECLSGAEWIRCSPPSTDGWTTFPDDVIDRITDRCDVVVRFGFGLIRGRILAAPKYGVLSYHPADIRRYRGLGPEMIFIDERDTAGVTLQRLNEVVDGGEVIAYGETDVRDCHTVWEVMEAIRERQIDLLSGGIANLRDPAFTPAVYGEEQLGKFYYLAHRETFSFSTRILLKNVSGRLRRRLH